MRDLPNEPIHSYLGCSSPLSEPGARYLSIFWPCSIFAVSISTSETNSLNLFEKAILKLAALGIAGKHAADCLCMDADFFRFIDARLRQQGYLTDDSRLSAAGREVANGSAPKSCAQISVYREDISGRILPFCAGKTAQPLMSDDRGAYFGQVSKKDRIQFPAILKPGRGVRSAAAPSPREIESALREYAARLNSASPLIESRESAINLENEPKIVVQSTPQFVYLHCFCVPASDSRGVLVWDPFGSDISERILTNALARQDEELDWIARQFQATAARKTTALNEPGFAPDLPASLRPLYRAACALKLFIAAKGTDNMEARLERRDLCRKFLNGLSIALEGMFIRLIGDRKKTSDTLGALFAAARASGAEAARKRAVAAAARLNLSLPENGAGFLSLADYDIKAYQNGGGGLRVLFVINLFMAQWDSSHPFASPRKPADLIASMRLLHEKRNAFMHGDMNEFLPAVDEMRHLLDAAFSLCREESRNASNQLKLLDRLELWLAEDTGAQSVDNGAKSALNKFISPRLLSRLGQNLYEKLLEADRALPCAPQEDRDIPQETLAPLAGFFELLFRHGLNAATLPENPSVKAEEKAREAGFSLGASMPVALATTKQNNINRALAGKRASLGGECIAWLIRRPGPYLARVASKSPKFLVHIAELINLRGHGNKDVSLAAAMECRDALYQDCEALFSELTD